MAQRIMAVAILRGAVPSGDGDGYGDGYGDGDGSGYGDGSGDGDGDGYGDGYGDGSSSGSGYGYGDGSSSGSGYGYGDGSGEYWMQALQRFVSKLSVTQQARAATLTASGARLAFWRSSTHGTASNGGRNMPVSPGMVEREKGPLRSECGKGQLHATMRPDKWKGERWWIVALIGEVRGTDEKYWALEREIIGECM